ncbi:unnamed protein product [Paramecium octaurelia]|uniref:Uncharacterized protein n=1 Tax=Paramecium octaurelia TaxID=43137 RepID=A0A8S1S323_PAROT|nr:unnamed protein product [Paramecium octaurelia]
MSEEELVNKFIDNISNELHYKNPEEVVQNVYQLIDLTQILLEKIRILNIEKHDHQQELEAQNDTLRAEIAFNLQQQMQMQRIQDELLQKQDTLYEKLLILEEELKQQQILNAIYKNQLESKQHNGENQNVEQFVFELKELQIENEYQKQQIQSLKSIISQNKQDYQSQLMSNSSLIQHQEAIIKNMKDELSTQRQQIRQLKSENKQINDQIFEKQQSALKEITNSPFLQNAHSINTKQKTIVNEQKDSKKNQFSSQKRYLQADDLYDVNQFTLLECELQDTNYNTTLNTCCRNSYNFKKVQINEQPTPVQRNIYKDFFNLTSQCVKLNLNEEKLLDSRVSHLFDEYVDQKIPYHQWYNEIKKYLLTLL